ncbi:Class E vacuolar protein-sorting machinery protein [Yarrowia sp. C11]|nr:Class E vacuolar protein-sorting machinery protein [Yarrowia sp. E02]KAG5373160.1 Class E vacuolar protein-sorting machinery protein [Yarrowia sp. C11]
MAAVINRSVTSLHNELEFLFESEVISKALYDDICNKIPRKLTPGQKLDLPGSQVVGIAEVTERVAQVQITEPSPPVAPHPSSAGSGGKVEALYDYAAQDPTDLALVKGDQIEIVEKLNNDWWKGRGPSGKEGIFPANYVKELSDTPYMAPPPVSRSQSSVSSAGVASSTTTLPNVSSLAINDEKSEKSAYPSYVQPDYAAPAANYNPPPPTQYNPPPPDQYGGYQAPPPPGYQGGYQPPPPQGYQQQQYYQPPPPQTVVVEQGQQQQGGGGHLKSIGSKFGNAAIFGAGATLGGDLINSIF